MYKEYLRNIEKQTKHFPKSKTISHLLQILQQTQLKASHEEQKDETNARNEQPTLNERG